MRFTYNSIRKADNSLFKKHISKKEVTFSIFIEKRAEEIFFFNIIFYESYQLH